MARYIFITGGVVSSLGKGLASAALGALLQARGYKVRLRKLDPYLNVDPGTMCPYQHGEVFVTDDGAETDLDLGHYERFTGVPAQPVGQHHHRPHLPGHHRQGAARRLSRRHRPGDPARHQRHQGVRRSPATRASTSSSCEIGGTVGDIEGLPFFEAIRQLGNDLPRGHAVFVHLTLVPFIAVGGRAEDQADPALGDGAALDRHPARHPALPLPTAPIPQDERAQDRAVLQRARDGGDPGARRRARSTTCRSPITREGLDARSAARLRHRPTRRARPRRAGQTIMRAHRTTPKARSRSPSSASTPACKDAYKSLDEALVHGGIANRSRSSSTGSRARSSSARTRRPYLEGVHGILVPGGFGERGTRRQDRRRSRFARERKVPYLRHLLRHADGRASRRRATSPASRGADSTEFGPTPGAGRRPDDRVDERQRAGAARGRAATSAAPCGSAPIRRSLRQGSQRRRDLRHDRDHASATATATRSTSHYRDALESGGPALLRHVARRPAARDRRAARPSLVHRRAVPPRAEVAARSSRIRCSRASSRRRWSRAGWCSCDRCVTGVR